MLTVLFLAIWPKNDVFSPKVLKTNLVFLPSRGPCPHVTIVRSFDQKLTSKAYNVPRIDPLCLSTFGQKAFI